MTLRIKHIDSGVELELYNAQTLGNELDASVDATATPGEDSPGTFLSSLDQQGTVSIQGAVTGPRLSRTAGYSSDPETALAEWLAQFETFCNGAPGTGHELIRDYRNDTLQGIPETIQWTARGGEPIEIGYSMSFTRGTGLMSTRTPSADTVSPGGDFEIAGRTIPTFREFSVRKEQGLEVTRRTFTDTPDSNDITLSSGANRRLTLTARSVGTVAERNQVDADLTDTLGQDTTVNIHDPITGRSATGMVTSYSPTDEAGLARYNEFGIEIIEGSPDG